MPAAALTSCVEPSQQTEAPPRAPMIIEFEAIIDPSAGTIELTKVDGQAVRGLSPVPVVQDGVPLSGPPNTVELVTTFVGFNQVCGVANSFCADVTMRSFYGEPLPNSFVQLTNIIPFAGHAPLNSDPPFHGFENTFGLWVYGDLPANGGAATKRWTFANDGTNFRIRGQAIAGSVPQITTTGVGFADACVTRYVQLAQTGISQPTWRVLEEDEVIELGGTLPFAREQLSIDPNTGVLAIGPSPAYSTSYYEIGVEVSGVEGAARRIWLSGTGNLGAYEGTVFTAPQPLPPFSKSAGTYSFDLAVGDHPCPMHFEWWWDAFCGDPYDAYAFMGLSSTTGVLSGGTYAQQFPNGDYCVAVEARYDDVFVFDRSAWTIQLTD
jgi:hypothetical protein